MFFLALGDQTPPHQSKRETCPEIEWDGAGGKLERWLYKTSEHKEHVKEEEPQEKGVHLPVTGMSLPIGVNKSFQQGKVKSDPQS
jgi:hypothetical protein